MPFNRKNNDQKGTTFKLLLQAGVGCVLRKKKKIGNTLHHNKNPHYNYGLNFCCCKNTGKSIL